MNLMNSLQTGTSLTNNWAVTNQSSLNECLDLFFLAGASRNMNEKDIISLFSKALNQDKHTTMKILFWSRDIRWGAGERRLFRIILRYLWRHHPDILQDIIEYVPTYWRWDDLFFNEFIAKHSMEYLKETITQENWVDDWSMGLLFKWLPREKSANKNIAKLIMKRLDMSPIDYRHLLAENSITVENQLCDKEFDQIEYKKVPSKAFNLYTSAFYRNDEERFTEFIEWVKNGKETINAWAIFPVDIYKSWEKDNIRSWYFDNDPINTSNNKAINAQWSQLPDYMNDENILAVCDTSGSMSGEPMSVSVSLWVYISERSKWMFKDYFITFEGKPRLQKLSGEACNRFEQIHKAGSDMSTNIQWVFELILSVAKRDKLAQWHMPTKIVIISDMEFNSANWSGCWGSWQKTNFQTINKMYADSWYKRPELIFWNVNGRLDNFPVQKEDNRTALVSGYSPSILKNILWGKDLTPMWVMLETIDKYSFIDKALWRH